MGKDNSKICSKDEFERFKYFHEWFNQLIEKGELPSEHVDKLYEEICNFETAIVQIAQKVGIDLSEHDDTVSEIWEQEGVWPTPCIPPYGDEYGEVASNAYYEYEEKTRAWKETIHDLNRVMIILHKNFEQQPEWIRVSEAAGLASVNPGTITRWANKGKIKSNGKTNRDRRIDKLSLLLFMHNSKEKERKKGYGEYSRELEHIPDEH